MVSDFLCCYIPAPHFVGTGNWYYFFAKLSVFVFSTDIPAYFIALKKPFYSDWRERGVREPQLNQ